MSIPTIADSKKLYEYCGKCGNTKPLNRNYKCDVCIRLLAEQKFIETTKHNRDINLANYIPTRTNLGDMWKEREVCTHGRMDTVFNGYPPSGIYSIYRDILPITAYVGQSTNIYSRLASHTHSIQKGTHQNSFLKKDVEMFGKEHFFWRILPKADTKYGLDENEALWAGYFMESGIRLYNGLFTENQQAIIDNLKEQLSSEDRTWVSSKLLFPNGTFTIKE